MMHIWAWYKNFACENQSDTNLIPNHQIKCEHLYWKINE